MNRKGFFGILLILIAIILLVAGGYLFFNFSKNAIEIGSGDLVLNIDYNLSKEKGNLSNLSNNEEEVISIIEKTANKSQEEPDQIININYSSNSSDYNNP